MEQQVIDREVEMIQPYADKRREKKLAEKLMKALTSSF